MHNRQKMAEKHRSVNNVLWRVATGRIRRGRGPPVGHPWVKCLQWRWINWFNMYDWHYYCCRPNITKSHGNNDQHVRIISCFAFCVAPQVSSICRPWQTADRMHRNVVLNETSKEKKWHSQEIHYDTWCSVWLMPLCTTLLPFLLQTHQHCQTATVSRSTSHIHWQSTQLSKSLCIVHFSYVHVLYKSVSQNTWTNNVTVGDGRW